MTTYTITTLTDNETYLNCSPEMLKRLRKTYGTKNVKATKSAAQKFWYYRGTMVAIVEEVTNGYTLVNAFDGSFSFRHATTSELEYR